MPIFTEMGNSKSHPKIHMKSKETKIAITILKKKRIEGLMLPDFERSLQNNSNQNSMVLA